MKLRHVWRVAALTVLVALVVGVAPVYAVGRGPVTNAVSYNGTVLTGSDEASVTAFIKGAPSALPAMGTFTVTDAGKPFTFDTVTALEVDFDAMVEQAYASTGSGAYAITPVYKVKPSVVNSWVSVVAKSVDRNAANAKRVLKKKRLVFVKEKTGWKVDRAATAKVITASIQSALASGSLAPAPVVAVVKPVKAKVTSKNIKKHILVVLSERRIYLYKGTKLEKKYRCAIGTPGHATPTGDWKIVAKKKNPSWRNPAPNGWGKNMPAYIAPGPRNPLGVRALYLNASGIRIHGTYKYWSIGHAASHGCMRMKNSEIVKLYPLVPVGTPVKIIK